jgi:hypothetical protein
VIPWERGRAGLDLAIKEAEHFPAARAFGAGGPMARRTFGVVDIIEIVSGQAR